ncbi:MAG: alpha/beta hydrolase [Spirochaetia bacterium]|nr:alpha/beta hydrolase [Spirochaetia bacterium]
MIRFIPALILGLVLLQCSTPGQGRFEPQGSARISKSKTVVFVHGMFMTPASWADWQKYFEAKGYKTLAPAWPLHEGKPADLRAAHPNPELARLKLDDVVESYRKVIREQKEKPILIGHSMGGLVVQLLMQEGLGAAGIAIDSAPPQGLISLKFSFLKSNWGVISPFANKEEPLLLTPEQFNYAFVNTQPEAEQKAVYDSFVVPESRLVGNGPTTDVAKIDFSKPRPPLLIIAGEEDHIVPASLNYSNFQKYEPSPSRTEFRLFKARTHWIAGQKGWEEVADFVLDWINRN